MRFEGKVALVSGGGSIVNISVREVKRSESL